MQGRGYSNKYTSYQQQGLGEVHPIWYQYSGKCMLASQIIPKFLVVSVQG